ncbi:MAG: hypothetical protein GY801_11455 [bacterium]|nr:hypothetical protein [bacterium]
MYELMNETTMEHETLSATDYYAAIDEAKQKAATVGVEFRIINNKTMLSVFHFFV